jgi:NAD(P)-dependent dehydrogenase (short-subunit alcohol dehydrogenase family)
VLITGATWNHGRANVLAFAEEGAPLLLCTRQSMELLEETAHLATLLLSVCCSPCLGSVLHARRRLPASHAPACSHKATLPLSDSLWAADTAAER